MCGFNTIKDGTGALGSPPLNEIEQKIEERILLLLLPQGFVLSQLISLFSIN